MYQVAYIPFKKSDFTSLLNTQTQEIFVSPKSICELFEISWNSQNSKMVENSTRWQYQTIMIKLPEDDRQRKLGIIPEKKMRSWICSINAEKVKPEIREQLIAFQDECDQVLHDYWTKGIAVNPRFHLEADLKSFIVEVVALSLKEAIQELTLNLSTLFVKQDTFLEFKEQSAKRFQALENIENYQSSTLEELNFLKKRANQLVSQAQMIAALAEEGTLHRSHFHNLDLKINSFENRLELIEKDSLQKKHISSQERTISSEQIKLLKLKVQQKGSVRKIWYQFNAHFDITRYSFLPKDRFQEALNWLEALT